MKKICLFMLLMTLFMSVFAQKKKDLSTVVNVNYCLPKIVYKMDVALEYTRYVPGPYWRYAEKELGLSPRIVEYQENWKITDIKVTPQSVPDPKAVYSISASHDYSPLFLTLSAEGFLSGVSKSRMDSENKSGVMNFHDPDANDVEAIDITKFDTYTHLKEILDTNYTFQEVDGEMKKIWDPIITYSRKTEQDNVKEAVGEILRIRAERVNLLKAENDVPDGKSLEIILKEYDRIENNYMSLFMGKKDVQKVTKTVYCTVDKADEISVAFRYSDSKGVTQNNDVSSVIYSLRVVDAVIPSSHPVAGEETGSAIYYRVPAVGTLQLLRGKEVISTIKAIVPQLGNVKRFPVEVIGNEGLTLEFHPQYGSLKSIKRE